MDSTRNSRTGSNAPSPSNRRSSGASNPNNNTLTSAIGRTDNPNTSMPLNGSIGDGFPRPALPPPLPPVERGSAANRGGNNSMGNSVASLRPRPTSASQSAVLNSNYNNNHNGSDMHPTESPVPATSQPNSTTLRASQLQQRPPLGTMSRPASVGPSSVAPPRAASAAGNRSTTSVNPNHNNNNNSSASALRKSRASSASRPASRRSSSRGRASDGNSSSPEVEELMPMPLSRTQPVERFFVETHEYAANQTAEDRPRDAAGQPRDENELLLEQFAEYTDDDSFFSSSSTVIEMRPNRMANDPLRGRATKSVHETLQLRQLTGGRVPQDTAWNAAQKESWLYQVHYRAIALQSSSFFIFPAYWTPRVVVYNIMHHWAFEMCLFFIILGYSIFQASWARYTAPKGELGRPDFMLWADVFYTVLYGLEVVFRLFASGFILHKRAFFRSPWHWLDTAVLVMAILTCTWWRQVWNFTAWRLIRCIKCLTYVPVPVRMKLLAKSLLRSTNRILQSSFILLYFIFFFALIGLQLFVGNLHSRCVSDLTGEVTNQICRNVATGQYWFYWGHYCGTDFTCVHDAFPNKHFDFRSFDDIGHAMLSTFQIMTFQGWSSLLQETNDGLSVMAFLYYAFTICVCTYVVPSLFLGVFVEKIERTSRLFVLKQLDFFDGMLQEQKQRMSAMVRLADYVQRDDAGRITHYPAYAAAKNISSTDDSSNSSHGGEGKQIGSRNLRRTQWTDEQRLQLQLSLTRQRDVAEDLERKRLEPFNKRRREMGAPKSTPASTAVSRQGSMRASSVTRQGSTVNNGPDNFALGGRVGAVQHHPSAYAIGASRQNDMPFAMRQEAENDRLRFLDPYTSMSQLPQGPEEAVAAAAANGTSGNVLASGSVYSGMHNSTTFRAGSVSGSLSRPPLSGASVLAARESVGVVPNRRAMSAVGSMARINSQSNMSVRGGRVESVAPGAGLHASAIGQPQEPCVVHDPEGGDFRYADTCGDKVSIIRNIIHMFSEGYPRILTQYLWEHRMMQYRYGLMPLSYTNRYEQAALTKLRRRRAKERAAEREEMRVHGITPTLDEDEDYGGADFDENSDEPMREARWMQEEGLVAGSMSPIRMAQNIKENAPITVFQWIMYFFILANAVFNASRFDTMPDYWEMGTFVAGVCFSALFTLELLMRLFALGPGPFFFDLFNLIEATFVVISLFQLGFSRTNTISLFNWVRFLKMFRVAPINPMRRVTRVLIHGFPDMVYALVFFSLYMFMWLLLGMSFFGSRIGWIDYQFSDYYTRANFDTFSHAAMAVAQAFSVSRDEWLYLSWSGMRVRGSYTVMYFIGTVFIAFIFRFFFIAVLTYAWQSQEEREEYASSSLAAEAARKRGASRFVRLPWFDFTVWRSFKHIHGGFERRDVAPDEVYFLNEDMRRQLRIAEAKDRSYKDAYDRALMRQRGLLGDDADDAYHPIDSVSNNDYDGQDIPVDAPQYVVVGGQLYRQQSLPHVSNSNGRVMNQQAQQPRYGRAYPVTALGNNNHNNMDGDDDYSPREASHTPPPMSEQSRSIVNPLMSSRHSLSPSRLARRAANAPSVRGGDPIASEGNPSMAAQLLRLGRASDINAGGVREAGQGNADVSFDDENLEHLLLPGPRLRYKSIVDGGHRIFERCLDCNTYKQMPLRAPPGVAQRTADDLHAEHCHMSAARSSKQLVLNALLGYVRMQADHEVTPTKRMVETILGQAWSCGMLLFDTIENLSCSDLPEGERDWTRMLQALEMQQWLLGLHVGEEQVGRATLAYLLAHQQKQEQVEQRETYSESWTEYSFFVLSPTNPIRRFCHHIVTDWLFEEFTLFVIIAATVCLAVYAPGENNRDMGGSYNSGKYKALHILDDIFAVIFAVEVVLKWIAMGVILPVGRAYFWHLWNIFDCFIAVISLVSWAMDDIFLRYLKVLRLFRVLNMMRFLVCNTSVVPVARAIWDSIPTLANVCLIMLMNYIVWAIIFVSMFMNKMNYCSNVSIVNRTECLLDPANSWSPIQRNFRNFYESLLTTFEISTGAEWLDVMYSAVDSWSTEFSPRANRHPYLGLVFIAYYYLSHFVLFSLFIASLIYCYMVAKSTMDGLAAAGTSTEQQLWLRMQHMVMKIKPKSRLLPMNNGLSRGLHALVMNKWFEAFMGLILTFNMVTMSLEWYHMNSTQKLTLDIFQWVFVGIFTVEVILRLIALGPRFFSRWAYCWDLLIMCLSYIQIGLNTTRNHNVVFNMNVLRMLRIGRFLHLVNMITPFQTYLTLFADILKSAVPSIINITLIYMLSVFIFAVVGLHFLGYVAPYGGYIDDRYNNFMTLVNSMIMVFRLSTLQNWATMLRGSLDRGQYCTRASGRCGPTDWAPVFYIPIVICFYLMMSTLYLAAIVDKYVTAIRMHSSVRRLHELMRFRELWSRRDPNGRLVITVPQLLDLLEELRLPLGLTDKHNRLELLRLLREYDIPDHNGYVYYYEVLLPLARRVMAISFAEENAADVAAGEEVAWRATEGYLGAVSASPYARDPNYKGHTIAENFAASFVQAAYRRDRCMRDYYLMKSALWRKGRAACDAQGLSYADYGFGNWGLAYPDPREQGQELGFALPDGAEPGQLPTYADPVNARIAKREAEDRRRRQEAMDSGEGDATLLPSLYRSAIGETEKRFGPDAPDAIRRHERRSDKLQRRRNLEEQERLAYEEEQMHEMEEEQRRAVNSLVEGRPDESSVSHQNPYYGPGGLEPSQQLPQPSAVSGVSGYNNNRSSAPASILRRSANSLYDTNPNSSSYQPPLGASPDRLRAEEQMRRSQASRSGAGGSSLSNNRAGTDSYYNDN